MFSNLDLTIRFFRIFILKFFSFLGIVVILLSNIPVNAATYTQTQTCTIPTQITNWNLSCSVPKFNSSLGQLLSIRFEMTGNIDSVARVENKDATSITVSTDVTASIVLTRPDTTTLVGVLPSQSGSDNFPSFDGVIDFSGTSGKTFPNLIASQSDVFTSTSPTDFTLFTGSGNISLPIVATGTSNFTGSANLATSVDTQAGANIKVIYSYEAQNLSINKSHVGIFTAGTNSSYTLTVNNLESLGSIGTITVLDTLPNGMNYISNTNPSWSCTQALQVLTCISTTPIPANSSSSFVINVSVDQSTLTNVTNTAQVSSSYVDSDTSNNQSLDATIVNHLPSVSSTTNSPIFNTGTTNLPSSIFNASANDTGDTLQSFTILSLPSNTLGILYLGNPSTTGVAVNPNQVLSLLDISNLYFTPVSGAVGSATFTYTATDSYSAIANSPATITLPISNPVLPNNSGNTIQISQTLNPNPTQLASQKNNEVKQILSQITDANQQNNQKKVDPASLNKVLGEFDIITSKNDQLVRTGYEGEEKTTFLLLVLLGFILITTLTLSHIKNN